MAMDRRRISSAIHLEWKFLSKKALIISDFFYSSQYNMIIANQTHRYAQVLPIVAYYICVCVCKEEEKKKAFTLPLAAVYIYKLLKEWFAARWTRISIIIAYAFIMFFMSSIIIIIIINMSSANYTTRTAPRINKN